MGRLGYNDSFFAIYQRHTAASLMFVSALGFALMATCVKLVNHLGIPVLEIVAARSLVSICLSYLDIQRKGISIWGDQKILLIARGLVGAVALISVYYAVTTLPLAESTILQYLHPVFTALLALFFLKEKIHYSTIICIMLSLIGLIIMINPAVFSEGLSSAINYTILPPWSIAAGLLGAFGSGVAYVLVRKLNQTEDSSVIIFYFPLVALPISLLLLGQDFVVPDLKATILLLFVGIFTQVGQLGLTKAMQYEKAAKATAYSYVQVIFATILGWAVFSEIPSDYTIIGGTLIILGATTNFVLKRVIPEVATGEDVQLKSPKQP